MSCCAHWTTATAWALCTGMSSLTMWWSTTRTEGMVLTRDLTRCNPNCVLGCDWLTGVWQSFTTLARSTMSESPRATSRWRHLLSHFTSKLTFVGCSTCLFLWIPDPYKNLFSGSRAVGGLPDVWLQSWHVEPWLYARFHDLQVLILLLLKPCGGLMMFSK